MSWKCMRLFSCSSHLNKKFDLYATFSSSHFHVRPIIFTYTSCALTGLEEKILHPQRLTIILCKNTVRGTAWND